MMCPKLYNLALEWLLLLLTAGLWWECVSLHTMEGGVIYPIWNCGGRDSKRPIFRKS